MLTAGHNCSSEKPDDKSKNDKTNEMKHLMIPSYICSMQ
jgi:hypothetical protein